MPLLDAVFPSTNKLAIQNKRRTSTGGDRQLSIGGDGSLSVPDDPSVVRTIQSAFHPHMINNTKVHLYKSYPAAMETPSSESWFVWVIVQSLRETIVP